MFRYFNEFCYIFEKVTDELCYLCLVLNCNFLPLHPLQLHAEIIAILTKINFFLLSCKSLIIFNVFKISRYSDKIQMLIHMILIKDNYISYKL